SYATAEGGLWASNPNVIAARGATNLYGITGEEIDVTAQAGSSMANKIGLSIVQGSGSAVQGAQDDMALTIINQNGAIGWVRGIAPTATISITADSITAFTVATSSPVPTITYICLQ